MIIRPVSWLAILVVAGTTVQAAHAQKAPAAAPKKNPLLKLIEPWPEPAELQARQKDAQDRPLFQQVEPLAFTLTANFNLINKDRIPNSTKRFPGVLTVNGADGKPHDIVVKLGTRGHFRLMPRNCGFAPLRIELPKDGVSGTPFEGQTTLKLGTHCQNDKEYEQFTLKEYLSYRMHNLVTPLSFRARLARATYVDDATKKPVATKYALFMENDNDVARRNSGRIVELPRVEFNGLDAETLTRTMLWEYMIGNTDFSIWALHNVRLVQNQAKTLFSVPYDFDMTGLVLPPYANADPRLRLSSVVQRLYRGPCRTTDEFEAVAAGFRAKRAEMVALVDGQQDLEPAARSEMKDYLASFFKTIETPASIKKQFVDNCKPAPTM